MSSVFLDDCVEAIRVELRTLAARHVNRPWDATSDAHLIAYYTMLRCVLSAGRQAGILWAADGLDRNGDLHPDAAVFAARRFQLEHPAGYAAGLRAAYEGLCQKGGAA